MSKANKSGRWRRRTVRLLTRNVWLKVSSLLLATSVWAWVQSGQVIERRTRAKIDWSLPEDLVSVDALPKTVVVTVSGPQGRVRGVDRSRLRLHVDLSDAEPGTHAVDLVSRELAGLSQGLTLVQLNPPALDIELEAPLTRRVRIKPLVMGEPAEGYQRHTVRAEPETVEIRGPTSLVRGISEVPTDIIDISGAQETRVSEVPLAIKEKTVRPVSLRTVEVQIQVDAIMSTREFDEVPVVVSETGWTANLASTAVTLTGPVLELGGIPQDQVSVIVHVPASVQDQRRIVVDYTPGEADVQITFPGSDSIEVKALGPSRFVLERAQ